MLKIGDKVTFWSTGGKLLYIHGIIKSFDDCGDPFVVYRYHCKSDWENFENYSGALTPIEFLIEGWI